MANEKSCPICGKPVGESGLEGLCPECMLKAGFPTGTEPGTGGGGGSSFVAPSVEEIRKLFPHLEVIEMIGRGGMGAVYKARQKELDRLVALKILPPGIGDDHAFADRFVREAKALAKLSHSNIVTLYEFDHADGLFYFMMEFVDGVNLRQLLHAGRLAPREALAIVPQICDALQYAHDHGIVHRDIKPENILLDRKGHVKVADFGVARLIGIEGEMPAVESGQTASASVSLTEAGKVMGTPQYMAPEQKNKPTEVDHRADIYSLGVVFYQMLTGELPGKRIEAPSKKFHLDVRLDEVVLRALEKEPGLRYQQASQLKTQIETIAQTPPTGTSRHEEAQTQTAAKDQSLSRLAGSAATSKTALIFAGLSGVLGIAAFCLFPRPPAALVWSVLVAALLGMFLGIATRKSRGGKQAIAVGGANIAIWLVVLILVNVASERDRRVQNREGARSDAPIGGQFTSDGHSIFIVDDNVDVHYLIYYDGAFTVSGGCQRNVHSLNWFEDRSIRLNSNRVSGRRFGFQRESTSPMALRVNGEEFDFHQGRVFVLQDEGTVEQVPLWLSVADARGLEVLPEIIAQARAQGHTSAPLPGTGPDEIEDFRHRQLSVNDLERISSKAWLKRLDLSFSSISDDDLKYLEGLKELEWLDLSRATTENGPAITDAGLAHLANLTKLRTLQLHGNPITDAGLEKLKSLPQLKKLQLGATRVTGEGLRHFTGLQWVRLDATPITDDGLGQLRNLTNLEQLYLDDTKITDAGLAHLVHLKKLRVLNLHDTKVTAEGIARLKKDLPNAVLGINEDLTQANRGSSFGPVIERVVEEAIDLDNGKLEAMEGASGNDLALQIAENIRLAESKGIDAYVQGRALFGLGMTLAPLPEQDWATVDPSLIRTALALFSAASDHPLIKMELSGDNPDTYAFKTREGSMGILQITGFPDNRPAGVKIRYKLVQNSTTKVAVSTSAGVFSQTAATFGPVIERVLLFGEPCAMKYFQFHTGNVIAIGDGPGDKSDHSEEYRRAEESGGLDASALGLENDTEKGIQFAGHGCVFVLRIKESRDWDILTEEKTIQTLQHESWLKGVIEVYEKDFPATYLFKTALGECGILQILGLTGEKPHASGVKIRYKLVQSGSVPNTMPGATADPEFGTPTPTAPAPKMAPSKILRVTH